MKRIGIITMVLTLSLLFIPSAAEAALGISIVGKTGDGVWDGNTWKVDLYPNEVKSTTVSLHNSYGGSLAVEVSILPDSLNDGNLTFELDKTSFTMLGRSYTDVILTVKAGGSTTPGSYTANLEIMLGLPPYSGGGGGGRGGLPSVPTLTPEPTPTPTPTLTPTPTPTPGNPSIGLNPWIGIGAGLFILVAIILGLILYFIRRSKVIK